MHDNRNYVWRNNAQLSKYHLENWKTQRASQLSKLVLIPIKSPHLIRLKI